MITKYELGFWLLVLAAFFFIWLGHRHEYVRKTKIIEEEYKKVWKKYYQWKDKKEKDRD